MRPALRKVAIWIALPAAAVPAGASVIDFETLPDPFFLSAPGGGQNIGSFYTGMTFGPDVTGLSVTRFGGYSDAAYPPHSGDVVAFSATSDFVNIQFGADQSSVGLFYTSFDPVLLEAFDAGSNSLGSIPGAANTDGSSGISDALFLNLAGIRSVTFTGIAGDFVFDDVTFTSGAPVSGVPEPNGLAMVAIALAAVALRYGIRGEHLRIPLCPQPAGRGSGKQKSRSRLVRGAI